MKHSKHTIQTDSNEMMKVRIHVEKINQAKRELDENLIQGIQSPLTGPLTLAEVDEMYNQAKKNSYFLRVGGKTMGLRRGGIRKYPSYTNLHLKTNTLIAGEDYNPRLHT